MGSNLVSIFKISWEGAALDGKKVDIEVRWVDRRMESEDVREDVLRQAAHMVGFQRMPKPSYFRLNAVVPIDLAGETRIDVSDSRPSGRARARLVFKPKDQEELSACFDFYSAFEDYMDRSDNGFVDGNEVGDGKFTILCMGPKKGPLLDEVREYVAKHGPGWRVF
jgi:hypothetical protein